jgi:hypothetical protein
MFRIEDISSLPETAIGLLLVNIYLSLYLLAMRKFSYGKIINNISFIISGYSITTIIVSYLFFIILEKAIFNRDSIKNHIGHTYVFITEKVNSMPPKVKACCNRIANLGDLF